MQFSLEHRTAELSVGEFASFGPGPREGGDGVAGLWRAQLGQHWHNELRRQLEQQAAAGGALHPDASFEVPISGELRQRGWTLTLAGRIDQIVGGVLREIKTVTRPLPVPDEELRADYPEYFLQIAAYVLLRRSTGAAPGGAELLFVETSSGAVQTVRLTPFDEAVVQHQLTAVVDFLEQRHRARERRRNLVVRPAFAELRPGQEGVVAQLTRAVDTHRVALFEAPTGFGKTGCVLEFALARLQSGRCDRVIWLTGKATAQLQVVETLRRMTTPGPEPSNLLGYSPNESPAPTSNLLGYKFAGLFWQVRNKGEHCVNHEFHCVREGCSYLRDAVERWPTSGLSRFYLDDSQPRDLPALRAAGQEAGVCPYEITRAALAYHDFWIGDFNYVFHPESCGLFADQPGFDPARTLLVIDEAHNLPARAADARSHRVTADSLRAAYDALRAERALSSLLLAWEHWMFFVSRLPAADRLDEAAEAALRDTLRHLARQIAGTALPHATLGPQISATLWQAPQLAAWLDDGSLEKLLWSPRAGELHFTCLDAAPATGEILRRYGGVVLLSATLAPVDAFSAACGLDREAEREAEPPVLVAPDHLGGLNKRDTRKLYRQLARASDLLRVEEAALAAQPAWLHAPAPWREGAYDVAVDLRVDTTLRQRERHHGTTATTIEALCRASRAGDAAAGAAASRAIAVFFPSYAYAETVAAELGRSAPGLRAVVQARLPDLAAQTAWIEEHLALSDALLLVLGGSFTESIDALGGRVTHAMVVGPALPEVNAVQRAKLAAAERDLPRDASFQRVYLVPGLMKVNQALGRLVRAPGQRAKVLLHCRRFAEPRHASLLAPEYQLGERIEDDSGLLTWLES
jgi:Rad3-related DNA helicase